MTTPPTEEKFTIIVPAVKFPGTLPKDYEFQGPVIENGGFNWRIVLKDQGNRRGLTMFLSCKPSNPRPVMNWTMEVKGDSGITRRGFTFFKGGPSRQSIEIFLNRRDQNEERKYHVTILKSSMIPYTDFSQPNPEIFADTIVMVEEQKFVVSKTTLANCSQFYNTFFFASEHGVEGFVLADVKAHQFQELLEFLYHTSEIYASNCLDLLEIATHIQHAGIIRKCEQFMMKHDVCPRNELLLIAQRFGLTELLDSAIQKQKELRDVVELLPDNVEDLERDTMKKMLNKMNELKKKEPEERTRHF